MEMLNCISDGNIFIFINYILGYWVNLQFPHIYSSMHLKFGITSIIIVIVNIAQSEQPSVKFLIEQIRETKRASRFSKLVIGCGNATECWMQDLQIYIVFSRHKNLALWEKIAHASVPSAIYLLARNEREKGFIFIFQCRFL